MRIDGDLVVVVDDDGFGSHKVGDPQAIELFRVEAKGFFDKKVMIVPGDKLGTMDVFGDFDWSPSSNTFMVDIDNVPFVVSKNIEIVFE